MATTQSIKLNISQVAVGHTGPHREPIKVKKPISTTIQDLLTALYPQLDIKKTEVLHMFVAKNQFMPPPDTKIGDLFTLFADGDVLRLEYCSQMTYG